MQIRLRGFNWLSLQEVAPQVKLPLAWLYRKVQSSQELLLQRILQFPATGSYQDPFIEIYLEVNFNKKVNNTEKQL